MNGSTVTTRFAPSPTGKLHIGGARTALFNWLFARAHKGQFYLRIEDTDHERSTSIAVTAIVEGLEWLGVDWDGELLFQRDRRHRHLECVDKLLASGGAYKCFCTPEDIERLNHQAKGSPTRFTSPWRDSPRSHHPDRPFCVRLKMPQSGTTQIDDVVHGRGRWDNSLFDDWVILRTSGTPTYNFAVVVDDHDMAISHVIRGDDHLINTAKQVHVYRALGWALPIFAHVPLILDENGKKLSKRTASVGMETYINEGIPAVAMRNYLARLGWSHGNDEFFTTEQAIAWFDLNGLRKSAARLDAKKLAHLSKKHLSAYRDESQLLDELNQFRQWHGEAPIKPEYQTQVLAALAILKSRCKSLLDLQAGIAFIGAERPLTLDEKAAEQLDDRGRAYLKKLNEDLAKIDWSRHEIEKTMKNRQVSESIRFEDLARPLRAALTGRAASMGVLDVMVILGAKETLGRIGEAIEGHFKTVP